MLPFSSAAKTVESKLPPLKKGGRGDFQIQQGFSKSSRNFQTLLESSTSKTNANV